MALCSTISSLLYVPLSSPTSSLISYVTVTGGTDPLLHIFVHVIFVKVILCACSECPSKYFISVSPQSFERMISPLTFSWSN